MRLHSKRPNKRVAIGVDGGDERKRRMQWDMICNQQFLLKSCADNGSKPQKAVQVSRRGTTSGKLNRNMINQHPRALNINPL
jgi:hypothetical protein